MVALSVMIPRLFRVIAHRSFVLVAHLNCQEFRVHMTMAEIGIAPNVVKQKKIKIGWRQNEKVPKVPTTKE
jgi:hypothetical protein